MRKFIFLGLILIFYLWFGNLSERENIIPTDAIRIRILANSNTINDQKIKQEVKEEVEKYLYKILKNVENPIEAEKVIKENINDVGNIVRNIFGDEFDINFGLNYFPKKVYKGIEYNEGYYNSLVISLGKGLGDNWWCILFPPLCMLEGNELDDVEYRSLVSDIIKQYFD